MTKEQKLIKRKARITARAVRFTKGIKKTTREAQAKKIIQGADKDIQAIEIKRTGNGIPDDATCIICEKRIRTGDYRILGFKDGKEVYRHEACAPGTAKWMQSQIGMTSVYRKYFVV